jgi:catechol 2,3-dioxygenase-like lactoylglutathione lyase family enzyme
MRTHYPMVKWLKRPSNRPFAGITTHDPDGNVFDISQQDMSNRRDVYVENDGRLNARYIDHFAMRTMRPEAMAEFYARVFELKLANRKEGDPNYCLSDGHMTLVVMPWDITDYDGTGIIVSGMDHIGFKVDDIAACRDDIARIAAENPRLAPEPVGSGPEGQALEKLFRRSCPFGEYHLADPDGVLIDVH